jgi:hypothetical protein
MKLNISRIMVVGFVLTLFGLTADPAVAQASRTWVSGVGDDANPCARTAPCKTFAGAISKTAPGGEIDCLDPGGFGAVTITKAITIDCTGTFGSVLVAGTNAIIVSAGANDRVILRGLSLNGLGSGLSGVRFLTGAQLTVENCFVVGFTVNGIDVELTGSGNVSVTNSYITGGNKGIFATATAVSAVTVKDTSILRALVGFEAQANVVAMLTNTDIASANNSAVRASGGSQVGIDGSTLNFNNIAINASASGAIVRISNSDLYNNGTNFSIAAGATILSGGDNRTTPTGGSNPSGSIPRQ